MTESVVGRILWFAVNSAEFRARLMGGMGNALAEEGFVLTDDEMETLREYHESFSHLNDRRALERINALARAYYR